MALSYLIDESTGLPFDSDTFDIKQFLNGYDSNLLVNSPEYRRVITKYNPLLFMLIYLPHLMRSEETNNQFSINDLNLMLARHALQWAAPKTVPKRPGLRKAYLAPRGSSKSTTVQAMILWAICHRHVRYVFLFAAIDDTAQSQFSEIRDEIANNKLIAVDYKTLTEPSRLKAKKVAEADSKNLYISQSGIIIEARSIWTSIVGAKRNYRRPDLIIMDDLSKGEGASSVNIASKQLDVVLGSILPMNINSPVWFVGTVHFSGSVEDELLRSTQGETFKWIDEENVEVHWIKPIVTDSYGLMRSIWKEKWPLEWLLSQSHTATYQKDFLCRPVPKYDGVGFGDSDFVIEQPTVVSKTILAVDPGVSSKGDATGIAVVSFSQSARKAFIRDVRGVHLIGPELKRLVFDLCNEYSVSQIIWEDNQGGEALPIATLGRSFPVPVELIHMSVKQGNKAVRAVLLLNRYKKDPNFIQSPNMVDSVGMAVEWFAAHATENKPKALVTSRRRV
jgi:hypothetical protein